MTEEGMKRVPVWYVITPAGKAGPYYLQSAARDAAREMNWKVVREWSEVPITRELRWKELR